MVRKLVKTKDVCEAFNASGDNSKDSTGTSAKYVFYISYCVILYITETGWRKTTD